jgi:hypothetical protein
MDESSLNIETEIGEYLNKTFSVSVEGVTQDEAKILIEKMPPFPQIKQCHMTLSETKEITAYEALTFSDGRAMLTQSLIEMHGKQGELIAYNIIRANRTKMAKQVQTTFKDFVADYCANLKSTRRTIFDAGLDVDIVTRSDTEFVVQVKECEWSRYYRERFPKVSYLVACSTDDAFAQARVPGIQMQRTKTLMEGGDCCDFRYYVPEASAG